MAIGYVNIIKTNNESTVLVKNNDVSPILVGDAVSFSPFDSLVNGVVLANSTLETTREVFGISIDNIPVGESGTVITFGLISNLDTSSFSPGDKLYLGATGGEITNVLPESPNFKTFIGYCITSSTSGQIFIKPAPIYADASEIITFEQINTYLGIDRENGSEHLHLNQKGEFVEVEPPAGGYSNNLYFSTQESDILGYKILTYTPEGDRTNIQSTINSGEGEKILSTYLYPTAVDVELFPAGLWSFTFYGSVSNSSGITQIGIVYFKRESSGVESDLFTSWSSEINNISPNYIRWQVTNPSYLLNIDDRMGARLLAKTTHNSNIVISYDIGDGYGAYLNNPNRIRHSQLRALNGDLNYQHVDSSEKSLISTVSNKVDKTTNVTAINDTGIADGEIAVFNLTNKDIRTSNVTIATTLGADDTTVPTSKAVSDVVGDIATALDTIVGV